MKKFIDMMEVLAPASLVLLCTRPGTRAARSHSSAPRASSALSWLSSALQFLWARLPRRFCYYFPLKRACPCASLLRCLEDNASAECGESWARLAKRLKASGQWGSEREHQRTSKPRSSRTVAPVSSLAGETGVANATRNLVGTRMVRVQSNGRNTMNPRDPRIDRVLDPSQSARSPSLFAGARFSRLSWQPPSPSS